VSGGDRVVRRWWWRGVGGCVRGELRLGGVGVCDGSVGGGCMVVIGDLLVRVVDRVVTGGFGEWVSGGGG
jgi:hypothetical protein